MTLHLLFGSYFFLAPSSLYQVIPSRPTQLCTQTLTECTNPQGNINFIYCRYTTKITPGAQRSTVAVPKSLLLLPALQLTLVFTEMQGPHGESGTLHQGDAKGRLPWTSARQSDLDAEIARKLIYTQRCGAAPREIGLPPPWVRTGKGSTEGRLQASDSHVWKVHWQEFLKDTGFGVKARHLCWWRREMLLFKSVWRVTKNLIEIWGNSFIFFATQLSHT